MLVEVRLRLVLLVLSEMRKMGSVVEVLNLLILVWWVLGVIELLR